MLHLVYIFAFTVVAFLAISNLIRSLITLSTESNRLYANGDRHKGLSSRKMMVLHPELLDSSGKPIEEPLLVMRSVSVEDARERLDAIYKASPGGSESEGL